MVTQYPQSFSSIVRGFSHDKGQAFVIQELYQFIICSLIPFRICFVSAKGFT